jgi:hypothetical protein
MSTTNTSIRKLARKKHTIEEEIRELGRRCDKMLEILDQYLPKVPEPSNEDLTTAQALAALTLALSTQEVDTIICDGETLHVTAFAELFTATEQSVYRIIGIESTEEEAAFIVIDELPDSPTSGEILRGQVITYPIRDSFMGALEDHSFLIAEKVEAYTFYMEAPSV